MDVLVRAWIGYRVAVTAAERDNCRAHLLVDFSITDPLPRQRRTPLDSGLVQPATVVLAPSHYISDVPAGGPDGQRCHQSPTHRFGGDDIVGASLLKLGFGRVLACPRNNQQSRVERSRRERDKD